MRVVKMFSEKPVEQNTAVSDYYPKHIQITTLMRRLRFLGLYRLVHACVDDLKYVRTFLVEMVVEIVVDWRSGD